MQLSTPKSERPHVHRHNVMFMNCLCSYMIRAILWIVMMEQGVSDAVVSINELATDMMC